MEALGKICVFDEDKSLKRWMGGILAKRGYEVFATSNLYQFLIYVKEMKPHLLVMNVGANRTGCRMFWDMISDDNRLREIPLVVMFPQDVRYEKHERISHVFDSSVSSEVVTEIAEVYCVGNKAHDVLLIDDYLADEDSAFRVLQRQNLDCFEVHNLCAAQKYLQRNFPRGICVCLPYEECAKAEALLHYPKIFYVENPARLKNIATLLN